VHDLQVEYVDFKFDLKCVVDQLYSKNIDVLEFDIILDGCRYLFFSYFNISFMLSLLKDNETTYTLAKTSKS